MPIFEYYCNRCEQKFEQLHRSRKDEAHCPSCGTEDKDDLDKLASSPAIAFKGTGFYATDYQKKS